MQVHEEYYKKFCTYNNTTEQDQNLFLFFLKEISKDLKWLSKVESLDFIKEVNHFSNKVKSNLGAFLAGRILFKALQTLYKEAFLDQFIVWDPTEDRNFSFFGLDISFYSRVGIWKSLGFFQASLLNCNLSFFSKSFRFFSSSCELSTNPVFLANLSETLSQYLTLNQNVPFSFLKEFIIKCSFFSSDYLLVHLKALLTTLAKSVHSSSLNDLFMQMAQMNSDRGQISQKFKKLVYIELGSSTESQKHQEKPILRKEKHTDYFLNVLFETRPDKRQLILKELKKDLSCEDFKFLKGHLFLVSKYSSYSLQYMFVNILCFFKLNNQEETQKLLELLKFSSFSEIRKLCFTHLSNTWDNQPSPDLPQLFNLFLEKSTNLSPSELEGHVNMAILQIEIFKKHFKTDRLPGILSNHLEKFFSNISLNISSIVDGDFLGFLLLSNRIFSGFSQLDISQMDLNLFYQMAQVLRSILNLISFIIEDDAPEGEEFDDYFHLYTDNKSRKICHYSWRIAK
jgi:hypothetical protein